jgi:hypothetical protein
LVRESATPPAASHSAAPALRHRAPSRQAVAWLAIAASVVIAFTLGFLMQRDVGHRIATVQPEADEPLAADTASPAQSLPDGAPQADALTLWVRDDAGEARPLRVPLVDAGALDRELGVTFQSAIPAPVRERLQQRGYDLRSKQRYAPLWLENGRPMIVPVEDTKIVPVGQNVY